MKYDWLKHYKQDEHPYVEKIIDWLEQVEKSNQPRLTDFLDPRQKIIIEQLTNRYNNLHLLASGGYQEAERVRVLIYPENYQPNFNDLKIKLIKIKNLNKFSELLHRDYLGAILNLGLKREKFGDLIKVNEEFYIVISEEIFFYLQQNLTVVNRSKVEIVIEDNWSVLEQHDNNLSESILIVSSLRLDLVISEVYNLARSKAQTLISQEKCKVNWQLVNKSHELIKKGDIISVRGFGRFVILEILDMTKKGKIRLKIGKPSEN